MPVKKSTHDDVEHRLQHTAELLETMREQRDKYRTELEASQIAVILLKAALSGDVANAEFKELPLSATTQELLARPPMTMVGELFPSNRVPLGITEVDNLVDMYKFTRLQLQMIEEVLMLTWNNQQQHV